MATITADFIEREARGIRGRYAVDIWERWKAAPESSRLDFLTRFGVPLERVERVAARLGEILDDEGI